MMLTLSLRKLVDGQEMDIMVDGEQRIDYTLKVLMESGFLSGDKWAVRSLRTKERIDAKRSYRENNIYNGDILTIE